MLTNKEVLQNLKNNHGDITAFAKFSMLSITGLKKKLKSEKPKDNLSGLYMKFILEQKKKGK